MTRVPTDSELQAVKPSQEKSKDDNEEEEKDEVHEINDLSEGEDERETNMMTPTPAQR